MLYKRGMGITLEESLNACEYIASEGNPRIVFCLRGVKTHLGEPHRNLVDFAHVPVVRRQTRLPVCIDPSHSVGSCWSRRTACPTSSTSIGQGIVAGASMVLVDFHPHPERALCDGGQALTLDQLSRSPTTRRRCARPTRPPRWPTGRRGAARPPRRRDDAVRPARGGCGGQDPRRSRYWAGVRPTAALNCRVKALWSQ